MRILLIGIFLFQLVTAPFFNAHSHAGTEPRETCREVSVAGALETMEMFGCLPPNLDPDSFLRTASREEIWTTIWKQDEWNCGMVPWILLNYPRLEVQQAALDLQLKYVAQSVRTITGKPGFDAIGIIRTSAENGVQFTPAGLARTDLIIDQLRKGKYADARIVVAKKIAPVLCADYGSATCVKDLRQVLEMMHPSNCGHSLLGLVKVYANALKDPLFIQGSSIFAWGLHRKLAAADHSGGHLFSDLLASFRGLPISEAQALEYAWQWIGIYATRGASWTAVAEALFTDETLPLLASLAYASVALGILDVERMGSGITYSFPPVVKTDCFHGRPYHFWMSAYLARNSGARLASSKAAYIAGSLYEFGSMNGARDVRRMYAEQRDSLYSQGIRANLVYKAAGARLGRMTPTLDGEWPVSLDISEGMSAAMRKGRDFPSYISNDRKAKLLNQYGKLYQIWKWMYSPQAIYFHFN